MKRLIISISFLLLNSIIAQEVNVDTTWTKTFIGNLWNRGGDRAVQQTSDGGFVFTGYKFNESGNAVLLIIKTDSAVSNP